MLMRLGEADLVARKKLGNVKFDAMSKEEKQKYVWTTATQMELDRGPKSVVRRFGDDGVEIPLPKPEPKPEPAEVEKVEEPDPDLPVLPAEPTAGESLHVVLVDLHLPSLTHALKRFAMRCNCVAAALCDAAELASAESDEEPDSWAAFWEPEKIEVRLEPCAEEYIYAIYILW